MKRIALLVLVTAIALLINRQAEAQRRVPHYQRTPTISPYVNLFRADNGGLNSFSGNYQPSQRLRQFVAETNREFYYQQRSTSAATIRLQQEIDAAVEGDPTVQQGLILRPTSIAGGTPRTAGTFLQHSRYFPGSAGTGSGGANFTGRGGRRQPTSRGSVGIGGYGGFGGGGGLGIGTTGSLSR